MRFSIIIPMYNAQFTLEKCVEGILCQSFGDYEVLIVDDCSTDASAEVAARLVRRDRRISVIASAYRGGAGAARNRGTERAVGDYVLYVDADDRWVRGDLLALLDNRITEQPADVYFFQSVKVTPDGRLLKRYAKPLFARADEVLALEEVYAELVRDGHALAAAWNKCVRRGRMEESGVSFREDVIGEDIDWVLQLFSHAQTICLLNHYAYAYTQHRSRSRSTNKAGPNDLVAIVMDWGRRLEKGTVVHSRAAAGVVAFEYGICMGNHHLLSRENRRLMMDNTHLLRYGLDRKTRMIGRFESVFGYGVTCLAVRTYLLLRKIW